MRFFVKTLDGKRSTISLEAKSSETIRSIKSKVEASQGIPADAQRLLFNGKQLDDEITVGDYKILQDSTVDVALRVCGGGKKRKKKVYTTPKKIKHKHKKVKLAVLNYYKVDDEGKVTKLRKECPNCGAGVFLANHGDRLYCGRCHSTYAIQK